MMLQSQITRSLGKKCASNSQKYSLKPPEALKKPRKPPKVSKNCRCHKMINLKITSGTLMKSSNLSLIPYKPSMNKNSKQLKIGAERKFKGTGRKY